MDDYPGLSQHHVQDDEDEDTITMEASLVIDAIGADSYLFCSPYTHCLAPLPMRPGYLCLRSPACKMKGHPEAGLRSLIAEGCRKRIRNSEGKVITLKGDVYLSISEFQKRQNEQVEQDMENLSRLQECAATTLPQSVTLSPTVSNLQTERKKNTKKTLERNTLGEDPEEEPPSPSDPMVVNQLLHQNMELMKNLQGLLESSQLLPLTPPPVTKTEPQNRVPLPKKTITQSYYAIGLDGAIPEVYSSLTEVREVLAMDTTKRPKMRRFGTEEAHRWLEMQYHKQE